MVKCNTRQSSPTMIQFDKQWQNSKIHHYEELHIIRTFQIESFGSCISAVLVNMVGAQHDITDTALNSVFSLIVHCSIKLSVFILPFL